VTQGVVVSIHVTPEAEGAMAFLPEVRAVAGRGLEGDRYFDRRGTYSKRPGADREVTLIEVEAIEALARDYDVRIEPLDSRRNLATRGVALNHLVDRRFWVGDVRLRGIRLCEPCGHLSRLIGQDVVKGLTHRGGLRAAIEADGVIRVGDRIRVEESSEPLLSDARPAADH
jgi:MOSC domain-containing protein YiiM